MAGKGFPTQPTHARERDTKRLEAQMTVVTADSELRGPDLPAGDWHAQTLTWWETWRRSAQAKTFIATDWDFLAETALLHTSLWLGNLAVAGELRLRTAKFGATLEDRARLKMQVDLAVTAVTAESEDAKVKAAERQARVLGLVENGHR